MESSSWPPWDPTWSKAYSPSRPSFRKHPRMRWLSFYWFGTLHEIEFTYYMLVVIHARWVYIAPPLALLLCWASEQKATLNTQPSWLGVCVCTFSKEVKPVLFRGDLLHELQEYTPLPFLLQDFACRVAILEYLLLCAFRFYSCIRFGEPGAFRFQLFSLMSRGLEYDSEVSNQRRRFWSHSDMILGRWNHVPAFEMNFMVINKCSVGLLVFLFQAVGLQLHRNFFFHDFGTWCLSFCTSVCLCVEIIVLYPKP